MRTDTLRKALARLTKVAGIAITCGGIAAVLAPNSTESAAANGDTRTLHLYHTHTGETIDATFRVDGHYDPEVLRQLNHFLRDWRNNDEISMDPRLFDAIWEAYRSAGATDRVQIYSAYRSPETNAMLRRRSRAVAEHSQHMLGKAMDTTMPGFPMERIREAAMKLQHGGVGWYPSANFVHIDVGGVRSWPRMSYDQLAGLFPDGKTVHIAADGRTLPGYEAARVELAQNGGAEVPPPQQSQGFFAWLFGGGTGGGTAREDEEDRRAPVATSAPAAVASVAPAPATEPQPATAMAYAPPAPAAEAPGVQQVAQAGPDPATAPRVGAIAAVDAAVAPIGDAPLPPRRPSELSILAEDVPLPPARPTTLASLDTAPLRLATASPASDPIGGLITATASGVPMVRASRLPPLITHGTSSARVPDAALAFAGDEPSFARVALPVPRPADLGRTSGLRAATHAPHRHDAAATTTVTRTVAQADDAVPVVAGPRLLGLRKAARMMAASNTAL